MNAAARKHIFVIDDDLSVQKSLKRLLCAHDYKVSTFGSAETFLKSAGNASEGCALLDVHMAGMNGLELQKKLNALGSGISLIFITADKSGSTEQFAMQAGAKAFLQKPFTQKSLVEAIERVFFKADGSSAGRKKSAA